jgi:hypothetical protein
MNLAKAFPSKHNYRCEDTKTQAKTEAQTNTPQRNRETDRDRDRHISDTTRT